MQRELIKLAVCMYVSAEAVQAGRLLERQGGMRCAGADNVS